VLLYFAQLAAFGACLSLGLLVKSATVQCAMQLVTVPLAQPEAEAVVPCNAPSSGGTAAASPH